MALNKAEWEGLSDKARWDIQVALRGPDSYYGETIKWYTTSVIRGHVRKVMRVGGVVNEDLKVVVLPGSTRGMNTKDRDGWNASHFVEHIRQAATWLNIPILTIPGDMWFTLMREDSLASMGKQALEYLQEQAKDEPKSSSRFVRVNDPKAVKELERHIRANGYIY